MSINNFNLLNENSSVIQNLSFDLGFSKDVTFKNL